MRLPSWLQRFLAPGYGTCFRCRRPWKFAPEHVTEYDARLGCFALCERCWQELATPAARLPYYEMLWHKWEIADDRHRQWRDIEAAVRAGK